MTWIVGAITPLGHTFLISDTRVKFTDGSEADLIQKSYCIGRYLVAGFAGSVRIGFHLLADLHQRLQSDDENLAWHPNLVAQAWAPFAARIYSSHDDAERALGCNVLLGGISPTEKNGDTPWPRAYLIRLAAPDFTPGFNHKQFQALHMGTGARFRPYRDLVRRYFRDPRFLTEFAGWGAEGIGRVLANSLSEQVEAISMSGVSSHMHVVACSWGQLFQNTTNHRAIDSEGNVEEYAMPTIATDYDDFVQLAAKRGCAAASAKA